MLTTVACIDRKVGQNFDEVIVSEMQVLNKLIFLLLQSTQCQCREERLPTPLGDRAEGSPTANLFYQ